MLALLQLLLTLNAEACNCKPMTTAERLQENDLVATIRIDSIILKGPRAPRELVEAEVLQAWKGTKEKKIQFVRDSGPSSMCGYKFKSEGEFLVFAMKQEAGPFVTRHCSGNLPLADAKKEIEWLKKNQQN